MKAFLLSLVLLAAITAAAAVALDFLTVPSQDMYSERSNVRL
jgi:hypothetical protein